MIKAEIAIYLKDSVLDPQGQAVMDSLMRQGFDKLCDVRVGRLVTIKLATSDPDKARTQLEQMCARLLANPVMERYQITLYPKAGDQPG
ncbi:MAG: phosphoribosylformylglycinamidine synthase subunit PurS [Pseudomonadota bacterium]